MDRDMLIRAIGRDARQRIGVLAAELVRTESAGKEAVLAEIEFRRWMAEACQECFENGHGGQP